ncbi:WD domain, G-beta repeat-containing protein, partial [Reticulomyxa filosa]
FFFFFFFLKKKKYFFVVAVFQQYLSLSSSKKNKNIGIVWIIIWACAYCYFSGRTRGCAQSTLVANESTLRKVTHVSVNNELSDGIILSKQQSLNAKQQAQRALHLPQFKRTKKNSMKISVVKSRSEISANKWKYRSKRMRPLALFHVQLRAAAATMNASTNNNDNNSSNNNDTNNSDNNNSDNNDNNNNNNNDNDDDDDDDNKIDNEQNENNGRGHDRNRDSMIAVQSPKTEHTVMSSTFSSQSPNLTYQHGVASDEKAEGLRDNDNEEEKTPEARASPPPPLLVQQLTRPLAASSSRLMISHNGNSSVTLFTRNSLSFTAVPQLAHDSERNLYAPHQENPQHHSENTQEIVIVSCTDDVKF